MSEERTVRLVAGSNASLTFGQSSVSEQVVAKPVETKVTLSVPAEATVTLAGHPTRQVGSVREFKTHRLSAGETWSEYTVQVSLERDGRTLTQERTIDLNAGDSREMAFQFDDNDKIAQRN